MMPSSASDYPLHVYDTQRRTCKRKFEAYNQDDSPLPSAFAAYGTQGFGSLSHVTRCTANRSASMDSEASSCSPFQLPAKRLCPSHSQGPPTPGPASSSYHWQQPQQQSVQQSIQASQSQAACQQPSSANAQKLLALKDILLNGSSQQVALVMAYLQQLQRLHQAASQVRSAQEHHTAVLQLKQILLQQQHQQLQQQQRPQQQAARQGQFDSQQRHSASLLSQQQQQQLLEALILQQQHSSADKCMHDVQTPIQPQELLSSTADQCQPAYDGFPSEYGFDPHSSVQTHFAGQHVQRSAQNQSYSAEDVWQLAQNSAQCQQSCSRQAVASSVQKLLHMQQQARLQQLAQMSQARLRQQFAQGEADRQLVTASRCKPSLGFPDLVAYWTKGLSLQRCESVHLACHLWTRVQHQVSIAYMHLVGAERPWETMLLGCLWLAAKLEECRRGVPSASKVGALVGVDRSVMGGVELYLMQLVNWAPMANWKDRPLHDEDASWY